MTDEIVDKDRAAAHAQGLVNEESQIARLEMMGEKRAAHQIEGTIREGKCERIRDNAVVFRQQMRAHAIKVSQIERYFFARKLPRRCSRDFAESSGHFQLREMLLPS